MLHVGLDNTKPLQTFEHVKKQGPHIKTSVTLPTTYEPQHLTSKYQNQTSTHLHTSSSNPCQIPMFIQIFRTAKRLPKWGWNF